MKNIHLIKEEYIKCGDCNKYYLCTTCGAQCGSEGHFIEISIPKQRLIDMMQGDEELGLYDEPKQETLEEVKIPIGEFIINNGVSIQGADGAYYHYSEVYKLLKLQSQRMYSEDAMRLSFKAGEVSMNRAILKDEGYDLNSYNLPNVGDFEEWFEILKKK